MVKSFAICDYMKAPSICLENLAFLEKGQLNIITKTTKLSSLQFALRQPAWSFKAFAACSVPNFFSYVPDTGKVSSEIEHFFLESTEFLLWPFTDSYALKTWMKDHLIVLSWQYRTFLITHDSLPVACVAYFSYLFIILPHTTNYKQMILITSKR